MTTIIGALCLGIAVTLFFAAREVKNGAYIGTRWTRRKNLGCGGGVESRHAITNATPSGIERPVLVSIQSRARCQGTALEPEAGAAPGPLASLSRFNPHLFN